MMAREFSPEELLGPLNEVEQKNAPRRLFVAGDPSLLKEGARVSIVGSRAASRAGLERARELTRFLCDRSVVVVSGLARGIDTTAHMTAIEYGGKTVAVLGTPPDQVYPQENASLQERIMRDFLCISQFPPGSPVQRQNFPLRNRTMALISDVTVIVEAGDKSGSLHQGWEALRLGRGLFITDIVATNPSLKWPPEMIRYGAQVLTAENEEDLFTEFLPLRVSAYVDEPVPF